MEKEKKDVYEKLLKIQTTLKAPKNQKNTFGNYNYRSCEDILEAVKPLLIENKLVLQITDELCYIGERYYIKASAMLIDVESEDSIINIAYAREEESKKGMDGSQITGASSSYARKYALNGLFLIDDTKDSDATNTHDKKESKTTMATSKQIEMLEGIFKDKLQIFLDKQNLESLSQLTIKQASSLIAQAKEGK